MNDYQLQAARYAMHKCRVKQYTEAVSRGEITPAEACFRYERAMANFDDIMNAAKAGHFSEAIEKEMAAFSIGLVMAEIPDGIPREPGHWADIDCWVRDA